MTTAAHDEPKAQKHEKIHFRDRWAKFHQRVMLQEFLCYGTMKKKTGGKASLSGPSLNGTNLKVAILMICLINQDNLITESKTRLAEILGMKASALSKALKELQEMNFLVRAKERGRTGRIMINPSFISLGNPGDVRETAGIYKSLRNKRS